MTPATAFFDSRVTGPAMPTAATTAPLSSRIGAATHTMPTSLSSSSTAQPRWRTAASALRKRSGLVTVLGVCATRPVGDHALDHLLRLEREDRLPFRGRVRGLAHAEIGARRGSRACFRDCRRT